VRVGTLAPNAGRATVKVRTPEVIVLRIDRPVNAADGSPEETGEGVTKVEVSGTA